MTWRKLTLVAAAVVASLDALSGSILASGAQATFPGRNGGLLLGGPDRLWLDGPDGRPHQLLTGLCAPPDGAVFTRSGQQIIVLERVICPDTFQHTNVVLINADGSDSRVLARFSEVFSTKPKQVGVPDSLAVSPDGRVLALGLDEFINPGTGHGFGQRKVVFIDIRTGRRTRSITLPGSLRGPTWSSNGKLLFVKDPGIGIARSGRAAVVETTRADGSHRQVIQLRFPERASLITSITDVAPSPDGSQLAVTAIDEPRTTVCGGIYGPCRTDLYLVSAAGGKAKRLTHSGNVTGSVWSPDGHQIALQYAYLAGGPPNQIITPATGHVTTPVKRVHQLKLPVLAWQPVPQ